MTEQQSDNLSMSPRERRVELALARLDSSNARSKIFGIDRSTIRDLCLRLVDRQWTTADAHRWLNKELGAAEGEEVVDDNAVYRFRDAFVPFYNQITSEEANRIARLTVAHATDDNIESMTRVGQMRMIELATEALISADNLHDLGKDQAAAFRAIESAMASQHDMAKLDLQRKQAEDRATKLEAEVEKLRIENESKQRRIDERVKALQSRIEELSDRVAAGKSIDPAVFTSIREQLVAMADPGSDGSPGREAA